MKGSNELEFCQTASKIRLPLNTIQTLSFGAVLKLSAIPESKYLVQQYIANIQEIEVTNVINFNDVFNFLTAYRTELSSSHIKKLTFGCSPSIGCFNKVQGIQETQSEDATGLGFSDVLASLDNIRLEQQEKYQLEIIIFKLFDHLLIDPQKFDLGYLLTFFTQNPNLVPKKLSLLTACKSEALLTFLDRFYMIRILQLSQSAPFSIHQIVENTSCHFSSTTPGSQIIALSVHYQLPDPDIYCKLLFLKFETLLINKCGKNFIQNFSHPLLETLQVQAKSDREVLLFNIDCPNLKNLVILQNENSLQNYVVDQHSLDNIFKNCQMLEQLDINITGKIRFKTLHQQLRFLTLKSPVSNFYRYEDQTVTEDLGNTNFIFLQTDVSAASLLDIHLMFPHLSHLDIDCFTSQINDDVLIHLLLDGFQNIQSISLSVLPNASSFDTGKYLDQYEGKLKLDFYLQTLTPPDNCHELVKLKSLKLTNLAITDLTALCMFSLDYHPCLESLWLEKLQFITDRFIFLLIAGTDFRSTSQPIINKGMRSSSCPIIPSNTQNAEVLESINESPICCNQIWQKSTSGSQLQSDSYRCFLSPSNLQQQQFDDFLFDQQYDSGKCGKLSELGVEQCYDANCKSQQLCTPKEQDITCYMADFQQDECQKYHIRNVSVLQCGQIDHQIIKVFQCVQHKLKFLQLDVLPNAACVQLFQQNAPDMYFNIVQGKHQSLFYPTFSNVFCGEPISFDELNMFEQK